MTNISEFRKNLKTYFNNVADKNNTVVVNSNGKSVMIISLDEYNKMDETEYLLSSKANKARLKSAIKNYKTKKGKEQKIIEV